ncbi:ras-related protein Rab-36-like [Sycon ciliatum]|uniref:ras-related protein Rab-36-like n=1 Tax=Sycon ciliatum TaxID=27933 RepID=UPI0031F67562
MTTGGRHYSAVPQPYSDEACHSEIPSSFSPAVRSACQSHSLTTQIFGAKVIVLGDSSVGKTSLIRRFVSRTFECSYKATIGVDFEVQKFYFLSKQFDLRIWDTAGNERFKTITSAYYRGSNAIILVYDASKPEDTLQSTRQWLEEANEKQPADGCLLFLVASKKDLLTQTGQVQMQAEGTAMAKELGAEFWAVSSMSGENVADFFTRVAALCFNKAVSAVAQHDSTDAGAGKTAQIVSDGGLIRLQKPSMESQPSQTHTPGRICCRQS